VCSSDLPDLLDANFLFIRERLNQPKIRMIAIADARAIDANSAKIINRCFAMNCFGERDGCCAFANAIRSDKKVSVVQSLSGQGGPEHCKLLFMPDDFSEAH